MDSGGVPTAGTGGGGRSSSGPAWLRDREGRIRLEWRLLLYLILFVVIVVAGVSGLVLVDPEPGLVLQSVVLLAAALAAGWILLRLEGRGPGALGFYLAPEALRESLGGLVLGVAVALAAVGLMAVLGGLRWVGEAGSVGAAAETGIVVLGFFVLPAAAEEALMRGYPLQAMAEGWGAGVALVATSVAFGLLHLPNPNVTVLGIVSIVAAGLFLGVVYLRTGSLWWATAAHVGWNWAHGFVADLPVSGLERWDNPLWEGLPRGPEWLGGGAFGPEGSVVAVAVLLAVSWLLWRSEWLTPSPAALRSDALTPLPGGRATEAVAAPGGEADAGPEGHGTTGREGRERLEGPGRHEHG